jgi:hypothetical protein
MDLLDTTTATGALVETHVCWHSQGLGRAPVMPSVPGCQILVLILLWTAVNPGENYQANFQDVYGVVGVVGVRSAGCKTLAVALPRGAESSRDWKSARSVAMRCASLSRFESDTNTGTVHCRQAPLRPVARKSRQGFVKSYQTQPQRTQLDAKECGAQWSFSEIAKH